MSNLSLATDWPTEEIHSSEGVVQLPEVKSLFDLQRPVLDNDPNELLKRRFLSKGGGLILTGQTGIGKSSLVMQLAMHWIAGRSAFSLAPARPLKILIVQAENDEADLAEMRDGVLNSLPFVDEIKKDYVDNLKICTIDDWTGMRFSRGLEKLLKTWAFDLVIIDPLFAYCGGNVSDQAIISNFLREQINPILHRYNVGCIFVHHVNKPPSGKDKPDYNPTDFAYVGAGSAELANWMRAGILLRSIGSTDVFELRLTKRGSRVGWKDSQGNRTYSKQIRHSRRDGCICWDELTEDEARQIPVKTAKASRTPSIDCFLEIFPTLFGERLDEALLNTGQIKNEFQQRGWSKESYSGMCRSAISAGKIGVIEGLPHNQKLYGLPYAVEAYHKAKMEEGSILLQPLLPGKTKPS